MSEWIIVRLVWALFESIRMVLLGLWQIRASLSQVPRHPAHLRHVATKRMGRISGGSRTRWDTRVSSRRPGSTATASRSGTRRPWQA